METRKDRTPDAIPDKTAKRGGLVNGVDVIRSNLTTLPGSPGVYRMLGERGEALYVGKARSLRKRVAAYTKPAKLPIRLQRMIAATRGMEFVTTHTEVEALLLESNMIKRMKPRYNVAATRRQVVSLRPHHRRSQLPASHQASRRADAQGSLFRPLCHPPARSIAPSSRCSAHFLSAYCSDAVFSAALGPACNTRSSDAVRPAYTRSTARNTRCWSSRRMISSPDTATKCSRVSPTTCRRQATNWNSNAQRCCATASTR